MKIMRSNLTFGLWKRLLCLVSGLTVAALAPATGFSLTVQDMGIGQNEVVEMTSSTLGTAWVYAGINKLLVNGTSHDGFCIDPFHWSVSSPQTYTTEPLSVGPKSPGGPMGAGVATKIEQLWDQYYSHTMSNQNAAGLQIAIWELIGTTNFKLDSLNDYGAGSMLDWVNNNPTAPTADLVALTGPGQDYVMLNVPDGADTILLLGFSASVMFLAKRSKCLRLCLSH